MLGSVFYTATHFGFSVTSFVRGENKVPLHVSIDLMNRTGHSKFRLDCRTKRKTKDGPFALSVCIPLDKVSLFPISIPLKDLPLKAGM